jgi:hypothetical protein
MNPIAELLRIVGPGLGDTSRVQADGDLGQLLRKRNGFYAFESTLHVFPSGAGDGAVLEAWNEPSLWKRQYGPELADLQFFAEDVFGGQFALGPRGVVSFDPETAETTLLAKDIDGWATAVLADYNVLTGYQIAHDWQARNRPLAGGERLVPKIPFVLGGGFTADNVYAMDAVRGMHLRADLARQIKNLPDGAQARYVVGP